MNSDNKATMTRDGKTFHWCVTSSFGRKRWTDSRHKPKDRPYKSANADRAKKMEAEDADRLGLLMMDLLDSGFCATAFS